MTVQCFKGIALFTPGGDLIYCLDDSKQGCWHSHLCLGLQDLLELPDPPYFLVPGYTATADRWRDPYSQTLKTSAELYPAVQRYQPLLNAAFGLEDIPWRVVPWQEESCHPSVIETYRHQFPQLWEDHDLIVRFDQWLERQTSHAFLLPETEEGYVLRLFVSGTTAATQRTLETIHCLLEQELQHPYTLKVIDISQHPEEAEQYQVSATPTLVRVQPQPVRRIVGELEDLPRVLQAIAAR